MVEEIDFFKHSCQANKNNPGFTFGHYFHPVIKIIEPIVIRTIDVQNSISCFVQQKYSMIRQKKNVALNKHYSCKSHTYIFDSKFYHSSLYKNGYLAGKLKQM